MSQLLERMGIKKTRQRTAIIQALETSNAPCSAEDLHKACPDLSLSTIYRNLEKLLSLGAVELLQGLDPRQRYYQLAALEHGHFAVCLGCHHKIRLSHCPVHDPELHDFTVTGHKIEIYGYCENCRQRS